MSTTNPYCETLGIQVPRLEAARHSADANSYALLIVALLERGEPITLEDAAKRFEEAGVAPADRALASLRRCRPARAPIYRDGSLYALDPYDHEADLWAFRLGLRPPKGARPQLVRPDPRPLPRPDEPVSVADLDEAWRDGVPNGWSAQRIAICVLDAHGRPMRADELLAFVAALSRWTQLSADSARYWRRGAAIHPRDDGFWELDRDHEAVRSARQAVRERLAVVRRWAHLRPDPTVLEATRQRLEQEREAHAEALARMRRVLVHAFPPTEPEAIVLVDVGRREISTFLGGDTARAREKLAECDIIAAVDVRALLRRLDVEPGERRLAELGPPQKTRQLNQRGRTLRVTTRLLIQGSCGIGRPLGDEQVLRGYLRDGAHAKFRRRLESDAKALFALYQYGRLHGVVRLRWGFVDEMIPAPWVHRDEPKLYDLMKRARELQVPLEVVVGSAPGWVDPWSRVRRAYVASDERGWRLWLLDEQGYPFDEALVQAARLPGPGRGGIMRTPSQLPRP
ncbi:MAG: hypothetical protein HY700_07100 [Gemmatimonadetes bacterium]|nr:hypothetical protein [Gemmatimonadota bacterium]